MHPVETILQSAFSAVQTELAGTAEAYLHRNESVAETEMPCICVNYGADTPDETGADLKQWGSVVEVLLVAKTVAATESEAREQLLVLRAEGHRAIRSATVTSNWFVEYGGASAPVIYQADSCVGEQTSRWLVHYQMPNDNPG